MTILLSRWLSGWQRAIEDRLKKVKGLGESDSDEDDVAKWVQKSRKLERKAAKRKEAELRRKDEEEQEEARRVLEEEKRMKAYRGKIKVGCVFPIVRVSILPMRNSD